MEQQSEGSAKACTTEAVPANLKTIREIISEILEINTTSIDKLESVNRGSIAEISGALCAPVLSGTLDQLFDLLKDVRKQSHTISRETNFLIGN